MNSVRAIQELNKRELEAGVSTSASWHADYRDTAYVYIGGLPFELSEGDVITIFSQFGEPTFVKLVRDKETGKSKGFAFLKYEDQRSTDLAVDNLGGATVMGRILRVDHTRYKRREDDEKEENAMLDEDERKDQEDRRHTSQKHRSRRDRSGSPQDERPLLKEEKELNYLIRDHDDDDPMKEFLIQDKREEVNAALTRYNAENKNDRKKSKHHHRSHKRDRSRNREKDRDRHRRRDHRRNS